MFMFKVEFLTQLPAKCLPFKQFNIQFYSAIWLEGIYLLWSTFQEKSSLKVRQTLYCAFFFFSSECHCWMLRSVTGINLLCIGSTISSVCLCTSEFLQLQRSDLGCSCYITISKYYCKIHICNGCNFLIF